MIGDAVIGDARSLFERLERLGPALGRAPRWILPRARRCRWSWRRG
ncbi:hypothetical protein ACN28S_42825 [Cystobacter fuscus]